MERKVRVGVVADDITGANDIGAMLAKNGYVSVVISLIDQPVEADFVGADALIINTGSRLDTPKDAVRKSAEAARLLDALGCEKIHTKTCSVFRGNIGASFDAVQDAIGERCSMVVLGFPANGRTTLHGRHYVRGVPLEQTSFAQDPVNPMRLSQLKDIIAQQSSRPCAEFTYEWLDRPLEEQQARLAALKAEARYVIFDVRDDKDLRIIARLIRDERSIAGASAICAALPEAWGCRSEALPCRFRTDVESGVLVVSGSLTPQTRAQTAYLCQQGVSCVTLDPARLLSGGTEALLDELADALTMRLSRGENVLLCADQDDERIHAACKRENVGSREIGRQITEALGSVARRTYQRSGVRRILVAGGETSDGVSAALRVRTMRIWQELEPGIPLMTGKTADGEELLLVFKSGSFGSPHFLYDTMLQMQAQ